MQTYPMVHALVRHGGMAAALVGALGGALIYALLKSYSELVTIIADMMLPK